MNSKRASAQFIFATILIDMLGVGLLIPIFPDIIRRFLGETEEAVRWYGYFISFYALMQFVASPILGALSDRFGRRPILLVSLAAAAVDYLIMAFASSFPILFVGRIVSGLTGASVTVATAYMADVSDDQNRSANFGMIGAAFGIGFILGPALGGILGKYGYIYPFIGAAVLNGLNFIFGLFVLPESLQPENRRRIVFKSLNPVSSLFKVFRPSAILIFVVIYSLLYLAGQVHPSVWTLYTQYRFQWNTAEVGYSLAVVGLSIAIVQGGLTRLIIPKFGEWNSLMFGVVISFVTYAAFGLAYEGWMMYAILFPSAFSGLCGPACQSLISKNTPANEQGELQGTLVGISSLTAIVGPILYTELFANFTNKEAPVQIPGAPYLAASLICVLSVVLLVVFRMTSRSGIPDHP